MKGGYDLHLNIKGLTFKHFKDNFTSYFIMFILLVIGIAIGSISIKILNIEEKNEIVGFFNSFFKLLYNDSINSKLLFKESLIGNAKLIFIIWITGAVIIGIAIIPIVVLFRGYAIGFTVGFLVNEFGLKGFLFSVFALLPQNIFIVPGIVSISSIGLSYSLNKLKYKRRKIGSSNSLKNFINYSSLMLLFCILLVIGSIVEAYITPIFMRFIVGHIN